MATPQKPDPWRDARDSMAVLVRAWDEDPTLSGPLPRDVVDRLMEAAVSVALADLPDDPGLPTPDWLTEHLARAPRSGETA